MERTNMQMLRQFSSLLVSAADPVTYSDALVLAAETGSNAAGLAGLFALLSIEAAPPATLSFGGLH